MVGGQLLRVTDWRGIFVTLGIIGAVLLVATLALLEETWQPRAAGSPNGFGVLLRDRAFLGFLVIAGCMGVVLFSYISMSPFVLREEHGVGPGGVLVDLRGQRRRDGRRRPGQRSAGRPARAGLACSGSGCGPGDGGVLPGRRARARRAPRRRAGAAVVRAVRPRHELRQRDRPGPRPPRQASRGRPPRSSGPASSCWAPRCRRSSPSTAPRASRWVLAMARRRTARPGRRPPPRRPAPGLGSRSAHAAIAHQRPGRGLTPPPARGDPAAGRRAWLRRHHDGPDHPRDRSPRQLGLLALRQQGPADRGGGRPRLRGLA